MNKKPILVVMAAGMGSRYGGLKQIDPIGTNGEIIIDFSLYDAKRAGFETVVCIIKHEIEEDFKALMERGAARNMDIRYAYQELDDIPEGFEIPEGRVKPWGTSHAILAARDIIDGPFAVINADCMAAYRIENTLTENGSVARGVCRVDEEGRLTGIDERLKIQWKDGKIQFTEDNGESWTEVPAGTPVSMNLFGFTESFMGELKARLAPDLERILRENPLKGEYLLPVTVSHLLEEGKAHVTVLDCPEKWYGVTYREDRPAIVAAMKAKKEAGEYPEALWK